MPQLLICDWDGTIANSVECILRCKQFLAKKYGLPVPSEELVRSVLGTKFEEALANCFPTETQQILSAIGKEFQVLMQTEDYRSALFPNVQTSLQDLKKAGIKLAVATSKSRAELDKALRDTDLLDFFDITCCGEEYKAKPDPAMLLHILNFLNVSPAESFMIGDTTTDVLFANNAGIRVFCVTFGAHSIAHLQAVNPDQFIDDWCHIPRAMTSQLRPC